MDMVLTLLVSAIQFVTLMILRKRQSNLLMTVLMLITQLIHLKNFVIDWFVFDSEYVHTDDYKRQQAIEIIINFCLVYFVRVTYVLM